MSAVFWMCTAVTMAQLPGLIIRYLPFKDIISKEQKVILLKWYGVFLCSYFMIFFMMGQKQWLSIMFYKWGLMIGGAICMMINIAVLRKRVKKHLFTGGLSAVWVLLMFTITSYLQHRLLQVDVVLHITIHAWCLMGALLAIYPLIRRQMTQTVAPFLMMDNENKWNNIWFIPYAMYLSCYLTVPQAAYPTEFLLVLSRCFMSIAILFVCRSVADDYASICEKERIREQLGYQKEYYGALSKRVMEARKTRHDFKHHIAAIQGFLDSGDIQSIREYCEELLDSQRGQSPLPYSGNAAVDGVLYHYKQVAQEKDIRFEIKGNFEQIRMKDIDLCVLLGNALDNAIIACENIEQKRFIHLSVKVDGNVAAIMFVNSFDGILKMEGGHILSRKREHAEGVGMTSIGDICQKYGGSMKTRYQEQIFTCLCLLEMEVTPS